MPINFGTDGWRAVISETFTFHNLRMVTQAIADAVASEGWLNGINMETQPDPKKMVVGFDTRFLSDRYAKEAARVLAANGFNVMLCQADAPTPVISYAVKNMQRYCRHHDHRLTQCAALQWRKIESRLWRFGFARIMPQS